MVRRNNLTEYYSSLVQQCSNVVEQSLSTENRPKIAEVHAIIFDFEKWITLLKGRPEEGPLRNALREYQISLLAMSMGQYNISLSGLRFFLENSLATIYLSAHEVELRLWLQDRKDIFWSEILDKESGVFSPKFTSAFNIGLTQESEGFLHIARKVYRELSEFAHGNHKSQAVIGTRVEFNEMLFNDWIEKAHSSWMVVLYCLALRYVSSFSEEKIVAIREMVSTEFSAIDCLREI